MSHKREEDAAINLDADLQEESGRIPLCDADVEEPHDAKPDELHKAADHRHAQTAERELLNNPFPAEQRDA